MAISSPWRSLEALPPRRGRDAMPGVYELADAHKHTIYIGQSGTDVPNRIRQHLARHPCLQADMVYWRYSYSRTPQATEADLIDHYRHKHGAPPRCNQAVPEPRSAAQRYTERASGS